MRNGNSGTSKVVRDFDNTIDALRAKIERQHATAEAAYWYLAWGRRRAHDIVARPAPVATRRPRKDEGDADNRNLNALPRQH